MQIVEIFNQVKSHFEYKGDYAKYGVKEKWVMPEQFERIEGDCEDFALACRSLCREYGFDSRLVLCKTEHNQMHCVLDVHGWILDNAMDTIKSIQQLNYRWLAISGFEKGEDWEMIVGVE